MDRYVAQLISSEGSDRTQKPKRLRLNFLLAAIVVLLLALTAFNFKAVGKSISALDEQTEPA